MKAEIGAILCLVAGEGLPLHTQNTRIIPTCTQHISNTTRPKHHSHHAVAYWKHNNVKHWLSHTIVSRQLRRCVCCSGVVG